MRRRKERVGGDDSVFCSALWVTVWTSASTPSDVGAMEDSEQRHDLTQVSPGALGLL